MRPWLIAIVLAVGGHAFVLGLWDVDPAALPRSANGPPSAPPATTAALHVRQVSRSAAAAPAGQGQRAAAAMLVAQAAAGAGGTPGSMPVLRSLPPHPARRDAVPAAAVAVARNHGTLGSGGAPDTDGAHAAPATPSAPSAPAAAAAPAAPAAAAAAPAVDEASRPSPKSATASAERVAPHTLPTYPTAPPPSLVLDYEVLRGASRASARLEWRVDETASAQASSPMRRYAISLRGQAVAPDDEAPASDARLNAAWAPHWTSSGSFDADGIAPERFAVSRRGRERHAANFRRDIGRISFSGPGVSWPLVAGAQDRLSWMVQLAAVLQADPALAGAPTARVSMMVVGAHGDATVWNLVAQGREVLPGPGGEPVEARLFRREAQHPHDTDVEVWVARELHHLPLRLRLVRRQGGESTEFRLRALQAP